MGEKNPVPWCSTQTTSSDEHVKGSEYECKNSCPVTNCPIGFYWSATEGTCYQVYIWRLVYVLSVYDIL